MSRNSKSPAKEVRDLMAQASIRLGLPAQATAGLSRIELIGNRQVIVENHRGVGAFEAECMELLTPDGAIVVHGRELALLVMNQRELVVTGRIRSVELPEED